MDVAVAVGVGLRVGVAVEVGVRVKVGETEGVHPPTILVTGFDRVPGFPQDLRRSVSVAWFTIVTQD